MWEKTEYLWNHIPVPLIHAFLKAIVVTVILLSIPTTIACSVYYFDGLFTLTVTIQLVWILFLIAYILESIHLITSSTSTEQQRYSRIITSLILRAWLGFCSTALCHTLGWFCRVILYPEAIHWGLQYKIFIATILLGYFCSVFNITAALTLYFYDPYQQEQEQEQEEAKQSNVQYV